MRVLKFIVDGQIIKKDPNCDFENLVMGSEGYLKAEFSFSHDWDNTSKVVGFWSRGKECTPQALKDGKTCIIPDEALLGRAFKIWVIGRNSKMNLITNKVVVNQRG